MKNSLRTLTRIQKFKIDEQRKILVEYQNQEDKLLDRLRLLAAEVEREKNFSREQGGVDNFGTYLKRCLKLRADLEHQLAAVRKKIAEIRDIMADMFKEQKTYEIVDENRSAAANKENELKEQKMLDEIGTNTYIKRSNT